MGNKKQTTCQQLVFSTPNNLFTEVFTCVYIHTSIFMYSMYVCSETDKSDNN